MNYFWSLTATFEVICLFVDAGAVAKNASSLVSNRQNQVKFVQIPDTLLRVEEKL